MKLGRYPFQAATTIYLEAKRGTIVQSTYQEEDRKLRYLAGVFEDLKKRGLISTTDPRSMGRKEIQELLVWMQGKGLDPETQAKYLIHIHNLLKHYRNHVFEDMKADGVRFPKAHKKPIRTIQMGDLRTIFDTIDKMEGWQGIVSRGLVPIFMATGIRPKELRLAQVQDLDLNRMKFFVRHPKGEGSWAGPTEVDIIRPDLLPNIQRFLKEREEYLRSRGLTSKVLFPSMLRGKGGCYTANGMNVIKRKIAMQSGVEFRLKDFRSTLTSMTVNGDLSLLPAMSAQLRHASMKTTQAHYARIEEGVAGRKLAEAWKNAPIFDVPSQTQIPKKGFIEQKFEISGYN